MKKGMRRLLKEGLLNEPRENPNKEKDLIVLIIGLVLMIFLVIAVKVSINKIKQNNNNQENIIKEESISLNDVFNNFKDNYNYKIIILDENKSYSYFEGKVLNGENIGIKTIDNIATEYKITEDKIINTKTNEEIDGLYKGYLYYFFIPNNIYNFIKEIDVFEKKDNNNYSYDSVYNDQKIKFMITVEDENNIKINYTYLNIEYSMNYSK